jgi:CHAT domain-containing protein
MDQTRLQCPEAETIAALAEGQLSRNEIAMLLPHIESCPSCRRELALASRVLREEVRPAAPRATAWWLALAAAAAVVVTTALLLAARRSPIDRLASAAPRSARLFEPRLAGRFAYAPYHGPLRAASGEVDAQQLRLSGTAGEVIERSSHDASPDAQHATGVAYLLIGKPREAIEPLRSAANARPNDGAIWSDLAAAQYAAAVSEPAPSLLPDALASADHALRIDAKLPIALFNRALILERLGLTKQAHEAWTRYLEVDASSPWAAEARARMSALPVASSDALFRRELPHLEQAAAAGDSAALEPIVRRWREQCRAWGEAEYLGRWSEAVHGADAAGAARMLAIARALGAELRRQSGESLLADAVAAIDRADDTTRALLAAAHATYRRGRIAYSRRQPTAAETDLRTSAALFAKAGSPMARMARYYAANTRFDQNDIAGARGELEALLADEQPAHFVSGALIRWELAHCDLVDGDFERALTLAEQSAAALRRADERSNLGAMEAMIAITLELSGRPDEAWAAHVRAFELLSRDGRDDRLLADIANTVTTERRAGKTEAAVALLAVERDIARDLHDDLLLSNTLTRGAVLLAQMQEYDAAARLAGEGAAAAARVTDPAFRAHIDANVQLARGAVALHADPRAASPLLAAAVRAYDAIGQRPLAIEARLLHARAALATGAADEAMRDIEAGLAAVRELNVSLAGRAVDPAVLDAGADLSQLAIRVALDRGDAARALAFADAARMQFTDAQPAPLAAGLARSGTAVLELVVLPDELVAFCIDGSGVTVSRQAVARDMLAALAASVATGDRNAAAAAYDRLVRPLEALQHAHRVIIVADRPLDALPFAALYDAREQRYFIEQHPLALAESAASLRPAPRRRAVSAVAAELPHDRAASLPDSAEETSDAAAAYAHGVVLPAARATFAAFADAARGADVVHVSGHTGDDGNGGTAALVFAPAERVLWRRIASLSLPRAPVVVLAACDSLRLPRAAAARAPSLGGAFLAAGAANVIGTLQPLPDRDARELFREFHRRLASGAEAADALRDVQLQAIARGSSAAWRALAVLTREIPGDSERGGSS